MKNYILQVSLIARTCWSWLGTVRELKNKQTPTLLVTASHFPRLSNFLTILHDILSSSISKRDIVVKH